MSSDGAILIVDDNRDNLFVLENLLASLGRPIVSARNGAEALSKVNDVSPILILMDLDMPVMDGWEAGRRLRANPRTASIPIIALSAHALLGDEERTIGQCCDVFISKPFSPSEVIARVKSYLGANAAAASSAEDTEE